MKISELAEAATIIAKYAKTRADEYCVQCEHDQIYIGAYDWPYSDEDRARLEKLGAFEAEESYSMF